MSSIILLKLEKIFNQAIRPFKMIILYGENAYQPFYCILSNSNHYLQNKGYDLYQIPPLMRTLAKKSKMLNPDLYEQLFNNTHKDQLCFILNWKDNSHKILIFDLENTDFFDEKLFLEILKNHYEEIIKLFDEEIINYSIKEQNNI